MNKKDKVRKHLSSLKNGSTFTMSSVAQACKVSTKDVSNVTNPMFNHGVFTRELKDKVHHYTVDQNAIQLYMAKYPNGQHPPVKKVATRPKIKRRNSVVIEIDNKIAFYKEKIANLQMMREEFS